MKKTIFTVIIALIIGGFAGFFIHKTWSSENAAPMTHSMDGMSSQMANMTDSIKDLEGDAFDKKFLEEMIVHHQGAVEMARMVLKKTNREDLKALASDILGAQTKEIGIMKEWLKTWFPAGETTKK